MERNNKTRQTKTRGVKRQIATVFVLLLLLGGGIGITTIVLSERLSAAAADDSDVILLSVDAGQVDDGNGAGSADVRTFPTAFTPGSPESASASPSAATGGSKNGGNQDFLVTSTDVELFRLSYDEDGSVTVRSADDSNKVFAPGTSNSYTYKLKNNGKTALEYTLKVTATVTPGDIVLPIEVRMNRYDGAWLLGSGESWLPVSELDGMTDTARLNVNNYAYYTLDWQWPFESGNDEYDTLLGNLSADEDITLAVTFEVVATAADLPADSGQGGSGSHIGRAAKTGDETNLLPYILLMSGAAVFLVLLLCFKRKTAQPGMEYREMVDTNEETGQSGGKTE